MNDRSKVAAFFVLALIGGALFPNGALGAGPSDEDLRSEQRACKNAADDRKRSADAQGAQKIKWGDGATLWDRACEVWGRINRNGGYFGVKLETRFQLDDLEAAAKAADEAALAEDKANKAARRALRRAINEARENNKKIIKLLPPPDPFDKPPLL